VPTDGADCDLLDILQLKVDDKTFPVLLNIGKREAHIRVIAWKECGESATVSTAKCHSTGGLQFGSYDAPELR
jgi:hypothetical protein